MDETQARKKLVKFFRELSPGSKVSSKVFAGGIIIRVKPVNPDTLGKMRKFPSEDWLEVQKQLTSEIGYYISFASPEVHSSYEIFLYPVERVDKLPRYVYHLTSASLKDKILKGGLRSPRGKVYVFSDSALVDDIIDSFSPSEDQYSWYEWVLVKIDTEKLPEEALAGVDKEFAQPGIYWISGSIPVSAITDVREFTINKYSGEKKWSSMSLVTKVAKSFSKRADAKEVSRIVRTLQEQAYQVDEEPDEGLIQRLNTIAKRNRMDLFKILNMFDRGEGFALLLDTDIMEGAVRTVIDEQAADYPDAGGAVTHVTIGRPQFDDEYYSAENEYKGPVIFPGSPSIDYSVEVQVHVTYWFDSEEEDVDEIARNFELRLRQYYPDSDVYLEMAEADELEFSVEWEVSDKIDDKYTFGMAADQIVYDESFG